MDYMYYVETRWSLGLHRSYTYYVFSSIGIVNTFQWYTTFCLRLVILHLSYVRACDSIVLGKSG